MRVPTALAMACAAFAGCVAAPHALAQQDTTVIQITDNVLVKDCSRFGINLGGDNYYSGAVLVKKRVRENFEGTSYRQCHFGPVWKENGASTWFGFPDPWKKLLIGGNYTILSGPATGATGTIKDITTIKYNHQGKMIDMAFVVFDKTVPVAPANAGLMVENIRLNEGQLPHETHEHWMMNTKISVGDVPPGSFGSAAGLLDGRTARAHIHFATHRQRYGQNNGTWHVHLWAKARSGSPVLKVVAGPEEWGETVTVVPTPEWKKYELKLVVAGVPEPATPKDQPMISLPVRVTGGEVLVDDIEAWLEGDENPTAFRDDCVNALKAFNPGVIRKLQMGGNTVRNTIMPPMRAHAFTNYKGHGVGPEARHNRSPYGLHEMYELCELVGAEPWYCLPGTLSWQEIVDFMEYLAGPPDTEYGGLRAELGHPQPWTDVFPRIHVEFGNEAWNSAGGYKLSGFNGPDYWKGLIATGKKSPYYKPNVLFHAGGQASNTWRNASILRNVPNADRFGVAPYLVSTLDRSDMELLDTDDKFFRWAFASPIRRSRSQDGAMYRNFQDATKAGIELSIYEINHHTTHGDAPAEPRNRLVTSIGGGINLAGNMLLMLKEQKLRTQALFGLVQYGFNTPVGTVRLWGTALNMRKGHVRYRPTFLACALANRAIAGDLVETVHTGADPKFSATGVFDRRKGVVETIEDIPVLWSYAFADGAERGLILINLDTGTARTVELRLDGKVAGGAAHSYLLTADKITDNNEFEQPEPLVRVREQEVTGFGSDWRTSVPPFSMLALKWRVE